MWGSSLLIRDDTTPICGVRYISMDGQLDKELINKEYDKQLRDWEWNKRYTRSFRPKFLSTDKKRDKERQ